MQQPTLIVEGNRHAVISLDWFDGKPIRATIRKNGVMRTVFDVSQSVDYYVEKQLQVNLAESLQYSDERENALIEHLENVYMEETKVLEEIAYTNAEDNLESLKLFNKVSPEQSSRNAIKYLEQQQKMFGMIDTIESVKAFLEGYYAKGGEN